jgi:hypothetical protein
MSRDGAHSAYWLLMMVLRSGRFLRGKEPVRDSIVVLSVLFA